MSDRLDCDFHTWTPDGDQHACTECEATCTTCHTCHGPTGSSLLVCQRCLDQEGQVLADIENALSHYQPPSPSPIPAIRYDRDRRGGNVDHVPIDTRDTPSEILSVLADWAEMWTDVSGDARSASVVEYLRGHLLWAAHQPERSAWPDYRREARQLRHRARRIAGLLPKRQAGTCIYCAGDVVRDWADERWQPRPDGLSDELRCTDCRTEWEGLPHWRYANLHTIRSLPDTRPDHLVTREHARTIFPEVPPATWRYWVRRDAQRAEAVARWQEQLAAGFIGPEPEPERMPVRSWDLRGQELYRLGDLTAHVEARAADNRRGPKARERKAG